MGQLLFLNGHAVINGVALVPFFYDTHFTNKLLLPLRTYIFLGLFSIRQPKSMSFLCSESASKLGVSCMSYYLHYA